jgi:anhydro-N-acetylmuramic acid kinase
VNGEPLYAVGTMVGTSLDGIDVALVEFTDARSLRGPVVVAFDTFALRSVTAVRLREIAAGAPTTAAELSAAGFGLAREHADAVRTVCRRGSIAVERISWIGAHGVTVAHAPAERGGHGWQLLNATAMAAWLDAAVVSDFRSADIALGGEGAPLAPVADLHLRTSDEEDRVVLNLGGIANLTALPAGARHPHEILAADVGPANLALDELHRRHTGGRETFDRDGARAARGRPDAELVQELLAETWVRQPLPRSFGREDFGPQWVDAYERRSGSLTHEDRLATLVELQSRAVATLVNEGLGIWRRAEPRPLHVLLTGGGRHHVAMVAALQRLLSPARVEGIEVLGENPDAKEAVDFALLGGLALRGRAAGASFTTGAARDVVLGTVCDPRPRGAGA